MKAALGVDMLQNSKGVEHYPYYLPKLIKWYTPGDVLKIATCDNAELLALSGPRNPYPNKLGVAEEGALADLVFVCGDSIVNMRLRIRVGSLSSS